MLGILLSACGSIAINIGNNLQALGSSKRNTETVSTNCARRAGGDMDSGATERGGCEGSGSSEANGSGSGRQQARCSTWLVGTVIFTAASIVQFASFAFAPASICAPLESLQFVSNLIFNR